jgi:hypothetical protein
VNERLIVTSCAAFAALIYGMVTRAWAIALAGQLFTALSVQAFCISVLFTNRGDSGAMLAPVANLAATSLLLSRLTGPRFAALPSGLPLPPLTLLYRLGANGLLIAWAFAFIDFEWRAFFFAILAAMHLLGGGWQQDRERSYVGIVYAGLTLGLFAIAFERPVIFRDLLAMLLIPASLRIGQRMAGEVALPLVVRSSVIGASLASVWLWLTRWVVAHYTTSGLTPAWALLALVVFVAGLALRERVYRMGGFALLALAIGRIFVVDIWQLETIYRILSFLVLGAVLLLLGYLYNRFADTIRQWL